MKLTRPTDAQRIAQLEQHIAEFEDERGKWAESLQRSRDCIDRSQSHLDTMHERLRATEKERDEARGLAVEYRDDIKRMGAVSDHTLPWENRG